MLLRHSALYLLGRLLPGVVSLLTLALYTRLLTAGEYGRYALVIAAVGIVNAICFQWLNLSLGRFLQAHDNSPSELLSTALTGFSVLVVTTGVLGCAAAWLWPDKTMRWLIILAVGIVWAQAWYDLNLKIVNARLAPVRYGLITSIKALLAVGVGAAFFYLGGGVAGILLGLMAALWLSTLFGWRHWHGLSMRGFNPRLLRTFIGYGAPLTLTFMLTMVLDSSDRFLLGWYINAKAVGAYAAAYVLTQQSLGMLMGAVHLAAFPLAVHALEEKGAVEARIQLRQNFLMLLLLSVPATVGLVMLANNIAAVVLGHGFRAQAGEIIIIVALATFVGGVQSYYFSYSFQLKRQMRGQVWTVLWAAVANVGLNLWWIPRHGVIGAAYATLSAFLVGLVVSWHLGKHIFALPAFPGEGYKVVLASLGMAACLWPIAKWRGPIALLEQILLGCIVYIVLLLIFDMGQSQFKLTTYFHKSKPWQRRFRTST